MDTVAKASTVTTTQLPSGIIIAAAANASSQAEEELRELKIRVRKEARASFIIGRVSDATGSSKSQQQSLPCRNSKEQHIDIMVATQKKTSVIWYHGCRDQKVQQNVRQARHRRVGNK